MKIVEWGRWLVSWMEDVIVELGLIRDQCWSAERRLSNGVGVGQLD
jgi:hypothetical protein